MKLYSANLSPFASRARMAVYAKGLPVEISGPPEGGTRGEAYLAINPMGKMPCLVIEGAGVPESEVILEYLEDKFPTPSLRPESAEDRARARLIARIGEIYVMNAGSALFGQMDPSKRDPAVVEAAMAKLHEGLDLLDQHLGDGDYAVGNALTTADCSLVPVLFWIDVFAKAFGRPDLLDRHRRTMAYIEKVRRNASAEKVWGELGHAVQHYQATGQII
jgi:glutathione S-transferase